MPRSILEIARSYVGQRETHGKNRSPVIDRLIKLAGGPVPASGKPGLPYCAYGISACGILARQEGAKGEVLVVTGSSQEFMRWAKANDRFITDPQKLFKCTGAVFGWTNLDKVHGHVGIVAERRSTEGTIVKIKTVEFNSNSAGSRDGEGIVESMRLVPSDRGRRLWFVDLTGVAGGDFGWSVKS